MDSGVTTVSFTLPSKFLANDVVDHRKLFPHLGKNALPSQQKCLEDVFVEGIDESVVGLSFMVRFTTY